MLFENKIIFFFKPYNTTINQRTSANLLPFFSGCKHTTFFIFNKTYFKRFCLYFFYPILSAGLQVVRTSEL